MLGERIKKAREAKGLTQAELGKFLQLTQRSVARIESSTQEVSVDRAKEIAEFLQTSVSYLSGETDELRPRIKTEKNTVTENQEFPTYYEAIEIPIYSISACAGSGFDNECECMEIVGKVYLNREDIGILAPEMPFGIMLDGDSMEPVISSGGKVIINPNIRPGRGDICLARFLDRGFFRDAIKFFFSKPEGGCILKSSEISGIPPMEFSPQEIEERELIIVGRVVYIDTGRRV